MRKSVDIWTNPHPSKVGIGLKEFLYNLHGPTWIDITGQNTSRTRVLVTLLHGNEPSGIKALFSWLTDPERKQPLTNVSIFVCSVEAAMSDPEFSNRYLFGQPDMNRCFRPPFDSENGILAEQVIKRIQQLKPEAIVDMHNTSGSGPDFAVATNLKATTLALAHNFSKRLVLTELKLGALMEIDVNCPIITMECGGSIDLRADQTALRAIEILTLQNDLFHDIVPESIEIFKHPLRFEIKNDATICYQEVVDSGHDVTLMPDIEKHNFGITSADVLLGWVGTLGLDYFTAIDDQGNDIKEDLFYVTNGGLYTARPLRLFMVTPRPEIARKDCLFYMTKADTDLAN